VQLFLSYAEEDRERAAEIAGWLGERGFEIYNWRDPSARGGRFMRQIEDAISQADAFLTLLSPSFIASEWCRREVELAIQREEDLRQQGREPVFIHVLRIAPTRPADLGFLRSYDQVNLTAQAEAEAEAELSVLAERLWLAGPVALDAGDAAADPVPPFRNRVDELERVLRGLGNASGPHFWLVVAPPQLGKTWFLDEVTKNNAEADPRWVTKKLDLRGHTDLRGNALQLLGRLFGGDAEKQSTDESAMIRHITRQLSHSDAQPHLCVLDSAELLDAETADTLRSFLSRIYLNVQESGVRNARLGLIVASRRDDQWRGVLPPPRMSVLSLTEFREDVARQLLDDLADGMGRNFSPAYRTLNAQRVHRLTEGLPALLVKCLQWIRREEWVELERLDEQALFEHLASPYIQDGLLTGDSLFPWREGGDRQALQTLGAAFRLLAPYRLFTQSHLRHHLASDSQFSSALANTNWSVEDLWRAISGTALLTRPLNEPWQEIYKAIRKLFYRYYYRSGGERAAAHREAGDFVAAWAAGLDGKEQVIGLVECLWHQAAALRLTDPGAMPAELASSAARLSQGLRPSTAYTVAELRDYAIERMSIDDEFQDTVNNVSGLFSRLVQLVADPPSRGPTE
jgi:TIR domain/AAA domain